MEKQKWFSSILVFLLCLFSQSVFAGRFFNVSSSGQSVQLDFILCLNAKGPFSCQHYSADHLNLLINTTIPHHSYPDAGIKINTPGYKPTNCTPIPNGYCLFSVSDGAGTSIPVLPTAGVAPSTPQNIQAAVISGQMVVTWDPSTGTAPIRYTVSASPFSAPPPDCVNTLNTSCTFTGLTIGTFYTFTVIAENAAGDSPSSTPSNSVEATTVPDAPTNVNGTASNAQVALTWVAPVSDGGIPITGYTVTSSPLVTTPAACSDVNALGCTFTGLTNGTTYTFTVVATNPNGDSVPSAPSNSLTPVGPPGPPRIVVGLPENTQIAVTWLAPLNDGGSPITGYTVTSSPSVPAPIICTNTTDTACLFTGLTNGTPYTFTVTATNALGTGTPSTSSTAVAPAAPLYINNGVIFQTSRDNGATWITTGVLPTGAVFRNIYVDALNIFTGASGGVFSGFPFVSTDEGVSWSSLPTQPDGGAIVGVFKSGYTLYTVTSSAFVGFYSSIDNGVSWTQSSVPSGSVFNNAIVVSGTTIYMPTSANGGVTYSVDGGATWINTTALPNPSIDATALFVVGNTIYVGRLNGSINISTDNGVTWTTAAASPGGFIISLFASNGSIYAATSAGLFVSTNGGATWQTLLSGTRDGIFVGATELYAATVSNAIHYSLNAGTSWSTTASPDGSVVLSVLTNGTTLYAGTQNGNVAVSKNNGTNWTLTAVPDSSSPIQSLFINGTSIYVGTQAGNVEVAANNGGSSWVALTQPDGSSVNSLYFTQSAWYAGTQSGNVEVSTNGGTSWTPTATQPAPGFAVNGVYVSGTTIYAGTGDGNVRVSTDGGTSWTSTTQPGGGAVKSVTLKGSTIYVGMANGSVKFSLDAGVTWQPTNSTPDGSNQVNNVFMSNFIL